MRGLPFLLAHVLTLALASALSAGVALAQMQCEGRLISYGATTSEVLEFCGEPTQRVRENRVLGSGLVDSPASFETTVPVEIWTYEQPGMFTRKLIFESGRLQKIETGGYADLEGGF